MNRVSTLELVILFCSFTIVGCKGGATVSHDGAAREMSTMVQAITRPVDSAAASLLQQAAELKSTMSENTERSVAIGSTMPILFDRINAEYDGSAKTDMMASLQLIRGRKAVNDSDLVSVQMRIDALSQILRPENIDRIREELIGKELEAHSKRKRGRRPSTQELKRMSERVARQIVSHLHEATSLQLQANQELRVLQVKQNSILFELQTLEANMQLAHDLWNLNSLSYFDTGADRLTPAGEVDLMRDLNELLDSLDTKLAGLLDALLTDRSACTIQLRLYVDAYADSQGYGSRSTNDRRNANLDLSQRRANIVFEHLKRAIDGRMNNVHWHGFIVEPALIAALGHGEELPWQANDWQPDGRPDADRRIAKVCVTFTIQPRMREGE